MRFALPSSVAALKRTAFVADVVQLKKGKADNHDSSICVREARAKDFDKVHELLLGFNNEGVSESQWRQLFVDHSGLQRGVFGYVMVDGDEVVGFLATTIGERTIRGKTRRVCNISNWIVKPAYRGRSLELLSNVVDQPDTTVTALSPAPHVLSILQMLRFETLDTSERIILPAPLLTSRSDVAILTDPASIEEALADGPRNVMRHHTLPYNKHLLIRAPEGNCYVLMNRSWKAIAGNFRLPLGRIHHIDSPDVFVRYADRVVLSAMMRLRVAALVVNERTLGGRRIWHSIERPGGPRSGAYRSEELRPDEIDGTYSEAVLLNY
jgi:hypothetical protein